MKEIQLTRGKVALVDDADFPELVKYSWQARPSRTTWYASRGIKLGGRCSHVLMHRQILGCSNQTLVDHRNHNGLDNRRENLREAVCRENLRNMLPRGGSSKFTGVSWNPDRRKWVARIRIGPLRQDGSRDKVHLGLFVEERDAAMAYDAAAREHFGEFACLNFPDESSVSWADLERKRLDPYFSARGAKHWRAKLSELDVAKIRKAYSSGQRTQSDIAREFGVTREAVTRIVNRINWRHVA